MAGSAAARLRRWATTPAAALVALLLGVYAYFYQAGGWNQNSRFNLVRATVEDGSLRTTRFAKNTGDDAVRDGQHYCDKAPGASWLCTPTYAVMYWAAGSPARPSPRWLAWAAWLSIVIAVSVPSIIAAVFLARLARALGLSPGASVVVALGWGLATMGLPYATLLYGNQIAGAFLLIAFTLLVEIRRGAPATRARMIAVGALVGFAGATEYPAALIAMPIGAYGLWVARLRPCLWAVLGGAVPLAALAWYHAAAFGSPTTFPYNYSVWQEPHTGWFMGVGEPHAFALREILVGEFRGLLYTTPWLALAVPGAVALAWRREHRVEVLVCAWAVIIFLWLNSSIPPWHGGWGAGPRYLVPMLPFAAMLAGGVLAWITAAPPPGPRRGAVRGAQLAGGVILAGLLVFSAAHMFAATAVKPEIDTRYKRPYQQFVWKHFRKGELSVSTQSIDMRGNPPGAPRQAWNLGMKAGLDGHASLVPLYVWCAGATAWLLWTLGLLPRSRRRAGDARGGGGAPPGSR
ncbi:MAG: hypothetical protein HS111_22405 [Kofleriaceae bacterium]|nr:hypothetical protein [Kofleriaceae bacterium]MCL4224877.1 hypothetical protein [Myxococcales bacterium]